MVLETAITLSVGWLLERITDKVKDLDVKREISKSLRISIETAYNSFSERAPKLAEILFESEFLSNSLFPEINKLILTRNENPDIKKIVEALPPQASLISGSRLHDEITQLIDLILEELKKHPSLQDFISHRQIEATNQKVDTVIQKQEHLSAELNQILDRLEQNQKSNIEFYELINDAIKQQAPALDRLNETLPGDINDRMDSFLNRQLDLAKAHLEAANYSEAHELLISLSDEITSSDSKTKFRWHTNLGAYYLAMGQNSKASFEFFTAHSYLPNDEKANANKIRAYIVQGDYAESKKLSKEMLVKFPKSQLIWALYLYALKLSHKLTDDLEIPDDVKNTIPVLQVLTEIKIDQGAYEEGHDLALKAYKLDPASNDLKRLLLWAALAWTTRDNVKAHFSQFNKDAEKALCFAIESFGDPIQFLRNIRNRNYFVEVATNLATASTLVGDESKTSSIVRYSYDSYPDEVQFLLPKIKDLHKNNDFSSIKDITESKLESLSTEVLFIIHEYGTNQGDHTWVNTIYSILKERPLNKTQSNELLGIHISALWNSNRKQEAQKLINDNLSAINEYIPLKVLYIRILDESGDLVNRDKLLNSLEYSDELSSTDILQIAEVLYDFKHYFEAAKFYELLIETPNDNDLSKRFISALIHSNQRSKAQKFLGLVSSDLQNTSDYRKLKANLAQICGDLETLSQTLSKEVIANPQDSSLAVWYAATMFRKNELATLKRYFASGPTFAPLVAKNEFELSKFEIELGFEEAAIKRIYKLFINYPNDPEVAGFYLLSLHLLMKPTLLITDPEKVKPGSWVIIEVNQVQHSIVIQSRETHLEASQGWTECIDEDSELANKMLGLKIDDSVDLGPGKHNAKIVQIRSCFSFALERAQEIVSKSFANYGPVWSVSMQTPAGEFDPSEIIESLKSRKTHVDRVYGVYNSHQMTLEVLAEALGTDILTLILEWPYLKYALFTGNGTTGERDETINLLKANNKKVVLDMSGLLELYRLNLLTQSFQLLGQPLVSLSLREAVRDILRLNKTRHPLGYAYEDNGKILFVEVTQETLDQRTNFIEQLLEFIDYHCTVSPVVGPASPSSKLVKIGDVVGSLSQDAIYLALEHDATLVTEDGVLRTLAKEGGVRVTTWIQPILMLLRDNGVIKHAEYSATTVNKLLKNHTFTSVDATDLLWSANQKPNQIYDQTIDVINTFEHPNIDLVSAITVGSEFLYLASEFVSPKYLRGYFESLESSLKKGRENFSRLIRDKLRGAVLAAIEDRSPEIGSKLSNTFGNLLLPLPFSPKVKVLTLSIKYALYS